MDHKGASWGATWVHPNWGQYYSLSYLGLARAFALAGDAAKAKKAFEYLFELWKDSVTGIRKDEGTAYRGNGGQPDLRDFSYTSTRKSRSSGRPSLPSGNPGRKPSLSSVIVLELSASDLGDDDARVLTDGLKFIPAVVDHEGVVRCKRRALGVAGATWVKVPLQSSLFTVYVPVAVPGPICAV